MPIKENARNLLLSCIAQNHGLHIDEAKSTNMPHAEFLDGLLTREIEYRGENRIRKRMAAAHFPHKKHLVGLDLASYDKKTANVISALSSLDFIRNKENVILIGNPGVGKTHLAIALGVEACLKDMRSSRASPISSSNCVKR